MVAVKNVAHLVTVAFQAKQSSSALVWRRGALYDTTPLNRIFVAIFNSDKSGIIQYSERRFFFAEESGSMMSKVLCWNRCQGWWRLMSCLVGENRTTF